MTIGTKSVLFGAHCFFIHPFMIALAWRKLYGCPWDPRLWVAFFVHDIGYWGKPNMDGPEGEKHPETGARIMGWLFDRPYASCLGCLSLTVLREFKYSQNGRWPVCPACREKRTYWHDLCLYHSRHYAKLHDKPFSRLCVADKLVTSIEPAWLYLPRVRWTGELTEYYENARAHGRGEVSTESPEEWYRTLGIHLAKWAYKHRNGEVDETTTVRHSQSQGLKA